MIKKIICMVAVFMLTVTMIPSKAFASGTSEQTACSEGVLSCVLNEENTETAAAAAGPDAASEDENLRVFESITYKLNDDGTATAVSCDRAAAGHVNIYVSIETQDVTKIGSNCFDLCTGITGVTIPDTVQEIGYYAFDECTGLTEVTIPGSVKEIGYMTFHNCKNLASVTIEEGVESIGYEAFANCRLQSVVIPESVTKIHKTSFDDDVQIGCYPDSYAELFAIENGYDFYYANGFDENIITGTTGNGTWSLNKTTGELNIVMKGVMFAYKKKSAPWTEYASYITSARVEGYCYSIGDYAFSGLDKLKKIEFANEPGEMGIGVFYECTSLEQVTGLNNVRELSDYTFKDCDSLKQIVIPDSVMSMGEYVFEGCSELEKVTLPAYITGINKGTFYACTSLKSVFIPDRVMTIGQSAFDSCYDLEDVKLPEGLTSIGDYAFAQTALKNIVLPHTLTSIGTSAFSNCDQLTELTIPESVITIGADAFRLCSNLEKVTIPKSVTVISDGMFGNCTKIKAIELHNRITAIGKGAFLGCKDLEKITIPNKVNTVGEVAFVNCESLRDVTFKGCPDEIAVDAFRDVTAMAYYFNDMGWTVAKLAEMQANAPNMTWIGEEHMHAYDMQTVLQAPTCTETGEKEWYCLACGDYYVETMAIVEHTAVEIPAVEATCANYGYTSGVKCSVCEEILTAPQQQNKKPHVYGEWMIGREVGCHVDGQEYRACQCGKRETRPIPSPGHVYGDEWVILKKATTKVKGEKAQYCTCGDYSKVYISRINTIKLSANSFVYTGKGIKPSVTVKDTGYDILTKGTDYTVQYRNSAGKVVTPKAVGTYKAVITFKGDYSGSVTRQFIINPKSTAITKLTKPGKKQFKVTWTKRTAQVTGYEIQYSTTKNFTKQTTKKLKVKTFKTNTKTIKQLKAKKKYWVKVRTYKNVNGKLYYSKWSPVKTVRTK